MPNTLRTLLLASLLLALLPCTAAAEDDAAAGQQLAPPGECAKPRGLPKAAAPAWFQIAGPPADRLVPTQVSAQLLAAARPGPPAPVAPTNPIPGLCDNPGACSSAAPAVIEPPPVPSLPPGLGESPRGNPSP